MSLDDTVDLLGDPFLACCLLLQGGSRNSMVVFQLVPTQWGKNWWRMDHCKRPHYNNQLHSTSNTMDTCCSTAKSCNGRIEKTHLPNINGEEVSKGNGGRWIFLCYVLGKYFGKI